MTFVICELSTPPTSLSQKTKKSFFWFKDICVIILNCYYTHTIAVCLVPLGCSRCFVCLEKKKERRVRERQPPACAVMWKEKSIFLKAPAAAAFNKNIQHSCNYDCGCCWWRYEENFLHQKVTLNYLMSHTCCNSSPFDCHSEIFPCSAIRNKWNAFS